MFAPVCQSAECVKEHWTWGSDDWAASQLLGHVREFVCGTKLKYIVNETVDTENKRMAE